MKYDGRKKSRTTDLGIFWKSGGFLEKKFTVIERVDLNKVDFMKKLHLKKKKNVLCDKVDSEIKTFYWKSTYHEKVDSLEDKISFKL